MNENVKTGLLIAIGVLTLINTVMIVSSDDGVSYEKTPLNSNIVSNAAATPAQQSIPLNTTNGGADVVPEPVGPKTTVQFAEMEHDFGTIEQNTKNPKTFTFTNTGSEPLIISNAKGSCGCTVPEYPREPIAPGETGEIKVVYSPGSQKNQQTKTVTITANTEPATTVLRIKANVNPGAADATNGAAQLGG